MRNIMAKTKKIPVIKNRVVLKQKNKRSVWPQVRILILTFAIMLLFVWIKIETNLKLAEIQRLETVLAQNLAENKKLKTEKIRLSSFGRIHKLAQNLGLEFLASEDIVQISKK